MKKSKQKSGSHYSLSLAAIFNRVKKKRPARMALRSVGFRRATAVDDSTEVRKKDLVSLIVKLDGVDEIESLNLSDPEKMIALGGDRYSMLLTIGNAQRLVKLRSASKIQTKKEKRHLLKRATKEIGLRTSLTGDRVVPETGKGVLVGIIDSGFDLKHPMFYDKDGNLRVKKLLDQTKDDSVYTKSELEAAWEGNSNPDGPGGDDDGHGTHVATIAGGSKFRGHEGVAPEAEFLLVKTNMIDTDEAAAWIFAEAGNKPCVINMSLGHHFGGHDGSDMEEQLHEELVGPGKIIVVAAGNERQDNIHIGGRFVPEQEETIPFDVANQGSLEAPFAALIFWYDSCDEFDFELLTPTGQSLKVPGPGSTQNYSNSKVDVDLGHASGAGSGGIYSKVQVELHFSSAGVSRAARSNWKIKARCKSAEIGRLDGWFHNSGFGEFKNHDFIETSRTLGMPATGRSCVAVASHVSLNEWKSDEGDQSDTDVLVGRTSPFSSKGPTRDGRQKPDISAPGQYLVAGLAGDSDSATYTERVIVAKKLAAFEGTSMAAPIVAGVVALMLEKDKNLTPEDVVEQLRDNAVVDDHTGVTWSPIYGFGKLRIELD